MTPRYGDHARKARELTEDTDRAGGNPYFIKAQEAIRKHTMTIEELKDKKILLIHESIGHSILKDAVTFGLMLFVLEMNYRYLDNNGVTAFIIVALFIVSAIMRATSYVLKRDLMNKAQAIAYIEEYYAK